MIFGRKLILLGFSPKTENELLNNWIVLGHNSQYLLRLKIHVDFKWKRDANPASNTPKISTTNTWRRSKQPRKRIIFTNNRLHKHTPKRLLQRNRAKPPDPQLRNCINRRCHRVLWIHVHAFCFLHQQINKDNCLALGSIEKPKDFSR